MIAVHAVLLESGFVVIDPISGRPFESDLRPPPHLSVSEQWPKLDCAMSVWYALPQILRMPIKMIFRPRGKSIIAYASFGSLGPYLWWAQLDERRFGQAIDSFWRMRDTKGLVDGGDEWFWRYKSPVGKQVYEIWKIVKDGIVLPLQTELYPKVGLRIPTRFKDLLPELKTKILELVPGVDVAKAICVCKGFKRLADGDERLWKRKFDMKFGASSDIGRGGQDRQDQQDQRLGWLGLGGRRLSKKNQWKLRFVGKWKEAKEGKKRPNYRRIIRRNGRAIFEG